MNFQRLNVASFRFRLLNLPINTLGYRETEIHLDLWNIPLGVFVLSVIALPESHFGVTVLLT